VGEFLLTVELPNGMELDCTTKLLNAAGIEPDDEAA
jgi:hypothetical protein